MGHTRTDKKGTQTDTHTHSRACTSQLDLLYAHTKGAHKHTHTHTRARAQTTKNSHLQLAFECKHARTFVTRAWALLKFSLNLTTCTK